MQVAYIKLNDELTCRDKMEVGTRNTAIPDNYYLYELYIKSTSVLLRLSR